MKVATCFLALKRMDASVNIHVFRDTDLTHDAHWSGEPRATAKCVSVAKHWH